MDLRAAGIKTKRIKSNIVESQSHRTESKWNEMNRLMFELRFLLVGKLSKGFAMSCTEKTFSKYLQIKRIGFGVRLSEEGYII